MGLVSLVSCRFRIRRAEGSTYKCSSSSFFLYRDSRAVVRLLFRTSPEDRKLESRSFLACSFETVAVALFRPDSRIDGFFSPLFSIRVNREPDTLALASRRSTWVVVSNVQLQPAWWSALRGVWLAGISAGPFARDDAALGRGNLRRSHVGLVARTAFSFKLEQFFTVDIHPHRGWVINTDGIRVQCIRARAGCSDPYALSV